MDDKENHIVQPLQLSNKASLNSMSSGHSRESLGKGGDATPKQPRVLHSHSPFSPYKSRSQSTLRSVESEIEVLTQPSLDGTRSKGSESAVHSPSGPLLPPINMEKSVNKERQYGDLLIKYNNLLVEFSQMEQDLMVKNKTINEQLQQISNYEKFLNHVKCEFGKTKDLMEKELIYYKEMIEDYQLKFLKLNGELEYYKKLEFNQLENYLGNEAGTNPDIDVDPEMDTKYKRLMKDYRILKSNFDIEQNSKIVLMDQIESLSKEIDYLKSNQYLSSVSASATEAANDNIDHYDFTSSNDNISSHLDTQSHTNSVIEDLTYNYNAHSMNLPQSGHIDDNDLDEEYINDQPQSSPIKTNLETPRTSVISNNNNNNKRIPSLIQTTDFQFPPSPDPETKTKRQSLPADLNTDFILSPLKLASQDPGYNKQNRYSISRPSHNRYSSHDIVPIQVEFENVDTGIDRHNDQRSASVPSPMRYNNSILHEEQDEEEVKELDNTFKRLIGEPSTENIVENTTTNTHITNGNQSARSSLLFENNKIFNNELTKQEIMKLKFELQSLKLHNEKLLSYIGFELQKQKKNIRKLKSRQNLEYSDSKLIERSKELLIQKKRVLRSVSINAILSKNYNNKDNIKMLQKGILNFDNEEAITNDYDDYEDFEEDEDDEGDDQYNDDYGFLKFNDKFSDRIFSNGLNQYYDTNNDKNKNLKKYKSQNFINYQKNFSDMFDSSYDTIDVDDESEQVDQDAIDAVDDCDWEQEHKNKVQRQRKDIPVGGLFNQIRYLITGNYKVKKHEPDTSIDDGLKYQFISIAIGILIIGIRFGHYNHQNV